MKLTNDSYTIFISTKNWTERYYRDKTGPPSLSATARQAAIKAASKRSGDGWVKVSARGRKFRATAEQVLNHVLPVLAGVKPGLTLKVEHREMPERDCEPKANKAKKATSH